MKYTIYTYDLWADQANCNDCASHKISDSGKCQDCKSTDIHTSFSVNDIFKGESVEAETLDQAINEFGLKMDMIEIDNNVDNENTIYFRYKVGKFNGSPACEIRREEK